MAAKKTNEQFLYEMQEHGNKNIEILGEYTTYTSKIPVRCKKCGYVWDALPQVLLNGGGCKRCAGSCKKTTAEFIEELRRKAPTIEVVGEYISNHVHVEIRCKKCGHQWSAMPSNLLRGYGCPKCKGGVKITEEEFIQRLKTECIDIEAVDKYINMLEPIHFRCLRCKNEWKTAPNGVLNSKTGCPYCAHNQTSFIEQVILEYFRTYYGEEYVLSRTREIIGSELDIVVLNNDYSPIIAIEPGSWTLHQDKVDKDLEKIKKSKEKGIDLLIIYDQAKDCCLEENDNIWIYTESFNRAKDERIIALLQRLSERFGIGEIVLDYSNIKRAAYNNSRRMSTEEFRSKIYKINPNIDVLGEYNGNNKKTLIKCKVCGYEWNTVPQVLYMGCSCPKCNKVPRKNTESFQEEMRNINPNLIIIGNYVNARTKIDVVCKKCGNEWKAVPDKLRVGRGCPVCAKKKLADSKKKKVRNIDTGEIFESIQEAELQTGASGISACCNKKQHSAGGYRWEYV